MSAARTELKQAVAERDGFRVIALKAMGLLDKHGLLLELRDVLDEDDQRVLEGARA